MIDDMVIGQLAARTGVSVRNTSHDAEGAAYRALVVGVDRAGDGDRQRRRGRRDRACWQAVQDLVAHVGQRAQADRRGGFTVAGLRCRAGAACNLGGLERWGWIRLGDGPGRRRGYGTSRGLLARGGRPSDQSWLLRPPAVPGDARHGGAALAGPLRSAAGRPPFEISLARGSGTLPWSLPEVHPSDGFATHATGGEHTPQDAPLVVLLGQRLTERTIGQESRGTGHCRWRPTCCACSTRTRSPFGTCRPARVCPKGPSPSPSAT